MARGATHPYYDPGQEHEAGYSHGADQKADQNGGAGAVERQPQRPTRTPRATYRVQLSPDFTFDDAAEVASYLADLGVSHLYCSPFLQAASGGSSGYDVVDHSKLDERLGGAAGYRRLAARLASANIGQVLDIVPNHMALAGRANAWWWDVLENGQSSRYAAYFDIDWDPPERKLTATVLMPVLGDRYGRVLEAGELKLRRDSGSFVVSYYEHEAPLSPRSLDGLLARAAQRAGSAELAAIAAELRDLPHAILTTAEAKAERQRGIESMRTRLAALSERDLDLAAAIDAEIDAVNADPDSLDELLRRQNYRPPYWGNAAEELSYRRFFDIDTLVGLRIENEACFADVHWLVLRLVSDGLLDGLRIDHVDGLADPEGYLTRLRASSGDAYIVVEKILGASEHLPGSWPVAGTSGYDFLNAVNQLFVHQAGEQAISAAYASFTDQKLSFAEVAHAAKLQITSEDLAAEIERLTAQLADICEWHRRQRDYTRRELREAVREMLAAFDVYRCYPHAGRPVSLADRGRVAAAVTAVCQRKPDMDPELVDFIGGLLVLRYEGAAEARFAVRFAQVSAPVMAKGVEDTAFYRYQPLICLNEVGGDPGCSGRTVADFHEAMRYAALNWPESMLTLSTHDTKRSGDVRARISVLPELPAAWEQAVVRWAQRNTRHKTRSARHEKGGWPDRNAEYLLYQTLVGAWPIDAERACAFMIKAAREAKVHTSWTDPRPGYEAAAEQFVKAVIGDAGFVADLEAFLAEHRIVARGRLNSLAQATLLLTCPGVPDLYQGTEVWDLSLVDPDNRRPVDYGQRRRLLADLAEAGPAEAIARDDEGGPKLWLIRKLLSHRRRFRAAYDASSGYEPLSVAGPNADRLVAFTRPGGIAVIVPRLAASATGPWTGTMVTLPPGRWVSVLTGDSVPAGNVAAARLLSKFPVEVLAREL